MFVDEERLEINNGDYVSRPDSNKKMNVEGTAELFKYFENKYANETHLFELVAMTTNQQKLVASRTARKIFFD